jgi:hypothetical protein
MKTSARDGIPYTDEAMKQDLIRVRIAWDECQTSRDRNAIYKYLTAVFELVAWWAAEGRAVSRGRWALKLQGMDVQNADEPFASIVLATADREKVDKRTRSKWSRVVRQRRMVLRARSERVADAHEDNARVSRFSATTKATVCARITSGWSAINSFDPRARQFGERDQPAARAPPPATQPRHRAA